MKPARVFLVDLSHGDAPWHSEFALDFFCCLLSLGIDAKQFAGIPILRLKALLKCEKKEDRMLEIRLAHVPVKFQGYFVNLPAGY